MRTSISKKLLAGALSVMMVLSLVAPTGAQAASKYSVTGYKTVKAGKTYTYKIKGVKKSQYVKVQRNVSGETVKYNKKKLTAKTKVNGTGKNLTLKVKFSEKNKNYTGKFTVRIYNAKSNKLVKRIVKSVKVKTQKAAKVAVTGVSLDNTTPKVEDTLTATVAPANATGVTYQWLADNAVIAGATSATYTVAETDLGKALSVTATDDQGNSVKSVETAKVESKAAAEIAVTAKQTHAKVIEVTYTTGTPSADNTYKVTKGAQTVSVTPTSTKENVVTLTASANLTDGEFKVEVATTAGKKAEATFTGAKPVLTEVKFTNNKISVSANTTEGLKKGYAHVESTDQFGDHMNLTSPSFTVSKGDYSFKADTGILTLDASNTSDKTYKLGEMVVVSIMYDNNTKVVPATLTVATAAMAKTITFGDLTSDDVKAYPVDKITQTNLNRGVYWFPVTEAKDDSDIALDAERLNDMIEAGTVFVTPKDSKGTIIYADKFSEKKVDGKTVIALVVKGGDQLLGLNATVDMSLSVFSVGGAQATLPVKIARDAVVKDLDIDIPELYCGKTCEIKLSATDTDGNKVDLYSVTKNNSLDGALTQTGVGSTVLNFYDLPDKTTVGTKLTLSTGALNADWTLVRNAAKRTVSLKITPAANDDGGYLNITGTTAAYTAITKANIKINATRTLDGIAGFGAAIKTTVLDTNDIEQDLAGNTLLTRNDGSLASAADNAIFVMDDSNLASKSAVENVKIEKGADGTEVDAPATPVYVYSIEMVGTTLTAGKYEGNAFDLSVNAASKPAAAIVSGTAKLKVKAGAATGKSDTVKIKLYKISKTTDSTNDTRIELLGTKSVTFKVENENTANYVLKLDADDNVLFAGTCNTWYGVDSIPFTLTTAGGAAVAQSKLQSVKVVNKNNDDATFDYEDGAIVCTNPSNKPAGTKMTATINVTIESDGDAVEVSKDFTYVTDQPVVSYTGLYSDPYFAYPVAGNKVTFTQPTIGDGHNGVYIEYLDQYFTDASEEGMNVDAKILNVKDASGAKKACDATAVYRNGVVTIYAGSSFTSFADKDTFQVVVNGGIGLTLYCTVSGAVDLGAAPVTSEELTYEKKNANAYIANNTTEYDPVVPNGGNVADYVWTVSGTASINSSTGALKANAAGTYVVTATKKVGGSQLVASVTFVAPVPHVALGQSPTAVAESQTNAEATATKDANAASTAVNLLIVDQEGVLLTANTDKIKVTGKEVTNATDNTEITALGALTFAPNDAASVSGKAEMTVKPSNSWTVGTHYFRVTIEPGTESHISNTLTNVLLTVTVAD
ncbi:MAG: hypothetical protein E7280_06685 [Lachnospiraceae bacterium]|nr:hypothetical protein [Lachnospiraceae bacterium]